MCAPVCRQLKTTVKPGDAESETPYMFFFKEM